MSASWKSRAFWAITALIALAVVCLAFVLTPSPLGHSTHTQLGLYPCGVLEATGYPCPGCGLTTSFANMAKLRFFAATQANPFGVLLFLTTLASIPFSFLAMLRGAPVFDTLEAIRFERIAIFLCVTALVTWLLKMLGLFLHAA